MRSQRAGTDPYVRDNFRSRLAIERAQPDADRVRVAVDPRED